MNFRRIIQTIFLLIFIAAPNCYAEKKSTLKEVNITADTMILYSKQNMTLFKGHVKAINQETKIDADELKVYYSQKTKSTEKAGMNSFEKIEATGNVSIEFKDKRAKAEKALYIAKDEKIILTGNRPLIIDGKNRIEGDKITWFVKKEIMEIEKKSNKQIKASFKNK